MCGQREVYLSTGEWDEDSVSGGGGEGDLYSGPARRWHHSYTQESSESPEKINFTP